ncbi:MAG: Glu-tRNA(Gln) amidotransferase GatDE subunit E, partial [Thermoplasmata archaeon]
KDGGAVLGVRLLGFAGLLKDKLGPELAMYARKAGVGGIFHSDELPAYGIGEEEVINLRNKLSLGPKDAFVITCGQREVAKKAIIRVRDRAIAALHGVPKETRDPLPDGRTAYSRPLPGRARMYPETDVPPIRIRKEDIEKLKNALPEMPWDKMKRLSQEYGISDEEAEQIVKKGLDDYFEDWAKKYSTMVGVSVISRALLMGLAEARKLGITPDMNIVEESIECVAKGLFSKDVIVDVIVHALKRNISAEKAARDLKLIALSVEDAKDIVDRIISQKIDFIRERGEERAFGPIMGLVMSELRGRIDGRIVGDIVRKKIREVLGS